MINPPRQSARSRVLPDESIAAEVMTPLLIFTGSISAVAFGLLLLAQWDRDIWPYLLAGALALAVWMAGRYSRRKELQRAGTVLSYTYALIPILTIIPFGLPGNAMIYLAALGVVLSSVTVSPQAPLQVARSALFLLLLLLVLPLTIESMGQPSLAASLAALVSMTVLLIGAALLGWVSANGIRGTITWALDASGKSERREKLLRETQHELEMALRERDQLNDRLYKLNQELEAARAAAEAAYRSKSSFMATMSHELRTPLNIIIGFSSAMIDHPEMYEVEGPEAMRIDIMEIRRSGQHLLGLINDILDLAKIEAKALELNRSNLPIVPLLDEMMQTARPLVKDRPVALRREYQSGLPSVLADEVRVRQVLLNLVSNASKFTREGEITIGARLEGDEVLIWVRDTGIGIAEADQERVFNRFEQASNNDTREFGGTGLGLAICRWLVELHGGRIWVESELDRGSTFFFTLPRVQAAPGPTSRTPHLSAEVAHS